MRSRQEDTHSRAAAAVLQDWNIRYALEDGAGGFRGSHDRRITYKQYQVQADQSGCSRLKVRWKRDRQVRDSNGEVGGRVLELSGAD